MAPASRLALAALALAGAASAAAAGPAAAPAPVAAASIAIGSDADGQAMLARLAGQRARVDGARLVIDDIAGEGRPWIGVVERRGAQLWLIGDSFAVRLRGPLARPRLAGPGYAIWVTGAPAGDALVARRLGVLAAPR